MGYYGISKGGMVESPMVDQQGAVISQFMAKLPVELQVVLNILLIVVIAAVVGKIIGNMYATIKYPDPEKSHIISPKLRVLFACILTACCIWLYAIMTKSDTELPQPEAPGTEQALPEDSAGYSGFGGVTAAVVIR